MNLNDRPPLYVLPFVDPRPWGSEVERKPLTPAPLIDFPARIRLSNRRIQEIRRRCLGPYLTKGKGA